ncbi:amidohydrolase family protein [Kordiimonas sp. SCSIO 12610]|uniref:N-acyl-D-amino-acid deacylase family protein n=1 Tax=Kordiimonas sp. SCSIO 12610 TaxID=2829597 RepID=UPI00210E3A68|nr:amidohydrolase family protein [Kordiimonas sp. SCSIO 12610]UTW53978.1 amidohydrolase family protein [Kordiimonas sp. SCSIO 12610]
MMNSRIWKSICITLSLCLLAACEARQETGDQVTVDYLLMSGMVYTGAKEEGRILDIGVKDDEIVFIGNADSQEISANEVIDVSGMIVSPGFIDIHTHALEELPENGPVSHDSYLFQGISTIFSGNDGRGPWKVQDTFASLEARGMGTNLAILVGHGAIRRAVMGDDDRAPKDAELAAMKAMIKQAMEEGALGLSTGLYYAPGSFAETDEVIELAKVAANYGGIYESHIRDESTYSIGLLGAVKETLKIGREANIPIHFAHIKALGVDVWRQSKDVVAMIEKAQNEGLTVTADQYPWKASGTRVSNALVPRWAMAGGNEELFKRLKDPELIGQIKSEMSENLRKRGGGTAILLTGGLEKWKGQTLAEYASILSLDEIDTAIEIVLEGDAGIASFNMTDEDLERFMTQPWVMTGSDGGDGHPRKYASFPQKYQTYVKEKQVISLTDFIHRSTGLTADTFGIKGRGYIREGYKADILVFDPNTFKPKANYENPHVLSEGVIHLFVNGNPTIKDSILTTDGFSGVGIAKLK